MIRTRRLLLRPARAADLEALHEIFSDPETMRYWDRPADDDIERTRAFLAAFMREDPATRYEFILDLDGQCVGKAGVWDKPEVGFILNRAHWGQGLVREALEAILPSAFAAFPECAALTAQADPRNQRSCRLLENLGFRLDRIGKKDFCYGGVEWCDTAYYLLPRAPDQLAGDIR
ncbi:GNAT family N-acetyltransferase [Primorskyibacter sp. S87]|uniref:GNAT family N-acetyltransferase n=1 Tax=Primorskyibacter sp. S87 TaxID=3415126 RepID=UPI003C7A94E3